MTDQICSIEGCERKIHARGWCSTHYSRWRRHDDPTATEDSPRGRRTAPLEYRFWAMVDRQGDADCWLWTGQLSANGYGKIKTSDGSIGVHRVAWQLHYGSIPNGTFVCHKCDVRNCVNPDHLFLGEHADNMRDMALKGRQSKGQKVHSAILSPSQVREIQAAEGIYREIGNRYGVSVSTVCDIKTGRSWAWIK